MPPFPILFGIFYCLFQFQDISVVRFFSCQVVQKCFQFPADIVHAAVCIKKNLCRFILQQQLPVFFADIFKGIFMTPPSKNILHTNKDHKTFIQFLIGLVFIQ